MLTGKIPTLANEKPLRYSCSCGRSPLTQEFDVEIILFHSKTCHTSFTPLFVTEPMIPSSPPLSIFHFFSRIRKKIPRFDNSKSGEQRMSYMTVQQAAEKIQYSSISIYRFCKNGITPSYKRNGKILIKEEDLERWLEEGKRQIPL
jgi:excisionase family DNA binding protein